MPFKLTLISICLTLLRFVGLQVINSDRFNGGQSLAIDVNDIVNRLTSDELKILRYGEFEISIPEEFKKPGANSIKGGIFSKNSDCFNNILCRLRQELILNREIMACEQKRVLDKFERLIDLEKSEIIKFYSLNDNDIILMDNTRWLHGRTEINDVHRHLVRIRFQTHYEELLPVF